MIELEDDGIVLAAIAARMFLELFDQPARSFASHPFLYGRGLIDIPLAIRHVVLAAIGRSAGSTEGIPLVLLLAPPGEFFTGFNLPQRLALLEFRRRVP